MAIETVKAFGTKFVLASGQAFALEAYKNSLSVYGYAEIALSYKDDGGATLVRLVSQLGSAHTHDQSGRQVWDVKFDQSVDQQLGTRSHTLREFSMHTDASFEVPPPQYVALGVVQEDRLGGGITQLLDGKNLHSSLSDESKETLRRSLFTVAVPLEFRRSKDDSFVRVPLLDQHGNFRFRHELLDLESLNAQQLKAVKELQELLTNEHWAISLPLPQGTILLIDNGRMFHARTRVLDKERHLLRMRFH